MSECESQCCVTPGGWQSYPAPLHICKEGMQHRVCRLHSVVLGRSTALGVRSQIPAWLSSLCFSSGSSFLICQMGMGQDGP